VSGSYGGTARVLRSVPSGRGEHPGAGGPADRGQAWLCEGWSGFAADRGVARRLTRRFPVRRWPWRWESAAHVAARAEARRGEVVISGPVSFAAFGVPEVVRELKAAAGRGARIDLVLETTADEGGTLRGHVGAAAAFAEIRRDATFWVWPAVRRLPQWRPSGHSPHPLD
jgi:hypothetical protein